MATKFNTNPEAADKLAQEFLARLRENLVRAQKLRADSDIDLARAVEQLRENLRIPADMASYAIRLAHFLADRFPTVDDLISAGVVAAIELREGDEVSEVGETLAKAMDDQRRFVRKDPRTELSDSDQILLLAAAHPPPHSLLARVVAEASERKLTILALRQEGVPLPKLFSGADIAAQLPAFRGYMLPRLFSACLDQAPAILPAYPDDLILETDDLISNVRRGRSAEEAIAGLLRQAPATSQSPSLVKRPAKRLEDLAGYGEAKPWALELSEDFRAWRAGELNWDDIAHPTLVLQGPPGTGKTSFARLLASNLEVPLIETSVATWNSGDHLSGTLQKMRATFDDAQQTAPCVLFIDEIDGISDRRSESSRGGNYWRQIINLLLELVSKARQTEGIILLGATNQIDHVDPAVLRSGRLDHTVELQLPDPEDILVILREYAGEFLGDESLRTLVARLRGFSGADIQVYVRSAKASARRRKRTLSIADIADQIPDPKSRMPVAVLRRLALYQHSQFFVAQALSLVDLDTPDDLPRAISGFLGAECFPTASKLTDFLTVVMAGRAGETLITGEASLLGAGSTTSDLALATSVSELIEFRSGFGRRGTVFLEGLVASTTIAGGTLVSERVEAAVSRATALLAPFRSELQKIYTGESAPGRPMTSVTIN